MSSDEEMRGVRQGAGGDVEIFLRWYEKNDWLARGGLTAVQFTLYLGLSWPMILDL
jgi:hypothetical protein